MSRVSFLYRTDVHAAEKGPASWKGDYPSEIWSNLTQVGKLANELDVTAVLDGGDYFHLKAASRNSHGLVIKTVKLHAEYRRKTYCVEGNHDLYYNNLESIDKQPLGVLYASGTFQHLREEVFEDGNLRVRVVGVPYSPFRTLEEMKAIQKRPGDSHLIVVAHALAGENPPPMVQDFFNEPVFRYEDLITPDGPDAFCFGHWHKDQGVVDISGRKFVNLGALSRGALINENLVRIPKVALIEALPGELKVTPYPMSVAPAEEVFDLEKKERHEREGKLIDLFVERLQADAQFDPSVSIEENVMSLGFAADVKQLVLDYLDRARAEVG